MKLSTALFSALSLASTAASQKTPSLRGHDQSLSSPFDELICSVKGKTDEDLCASTTNKASEACSFCTVKDSGDNSGLCVDPSVASQMMQMNPKISCTNTDTASPILDEPGLGLSSAYAFTAAGQVEEDDQDLSGPFDALKCTMEAKSDETKCSTSVNADNDPCEYCTLSENGEEAGLCVDPQVAEQMKHMNPDVSCSSGTLVSEEVDFAGPFDSLKCTFEGRSDEGKCSTALNADDEPCSFCTMTKNGQESGLCVDPAVAVKMKEQNPDISCTNTQVLDTINTSINKEDFKCSIEGMADADKCSSASSADEQQCEYCNISGFFGSHGICVSPDQADKLVKNIGDEKVSCISHSGIKLSEPLTSSPITDCNIDGVDNETCLDPSKVNGSQCIWCDAGIGGFCFPKSWESTASHFLKCGDSKSLLEETKPKTHDKLDFDPSVFKSSCFQVGLHGSSPDDCREAVDDVSGDHCVFCDAPKLGGIGLCMPPLYKGTEGSFYTCDKDTLLAQE